MGTVCRSLSFRSYVKTSKKHVRCFEYSKVLYMIKDCHIVWYRLKHSSPLPGLLRPGAEVSLTSCPSAGSLAALLLCLHMYFFKFFIILFTLGMSAGFPHVQCHDRMK